MCAVARAERLMIPAARVRAAVAQAMEPLESRLLFAAGELDLTFGGTGQVTTDFLSRNDFAQAVAVQADNKVLLAGWVVTGTGRGNDIAVARFNADGTPDASFGTSGKVMTDLGSMIDTAYAVAVQPDGRIVVAGNTRGTGAGQNFAVIRYNPDGSLDESFGTGGIARTDLGYLATDQATAMTLTPDGGIVIVGSTIIAGNQQFAAVRYTSSGQLDGSFGDGDGIVVHAFTNGAGQAKAITMRPDGTMILAGALYDFSTIGSDFAAVRLFADGTLDESFGTAGWATVSMGGVTESAGAVVVQETGHIVLVGEFTKDDRQDVALARLTASGQIDPSFGGTGTGYVVTDFADGIDWATGAVLQADGKIVIAGNGTVDGLYQMAVARYTVSGTPDAGFAGGAGTLTIAFDGATQSFAEGGIALDGHSRLVVGGHVARGTSFDMAVMRLENVVNVAPIANAGGPYTVVAGASVQLSGAASSDVDGSIVAYEWDLDYDGTFAVDAPGNMPMFAAPGDAGGTTQTIALRVTDNFGATSIATATITITPPQAPGTAMLVDDPSAPGRKMLSVMGTSGSDAVRFKEKKGSVEVRLRNKKLGEFSGMTRIVVDGGAGDDAIDAMKMSIPVVLFGGAGDDYLVGGDGDDVLVGGAGDDVISGSFGNDVIVGGAGRDRLFSFMGNDLVVAGSLSFEDNLSAMTAVLSEWSRADSTLAQRIANLTDGGGNNGLVNLGGDNVVDDNDRDSMFGTVGADWLINGAGDRVQRIR